MHPDRMDAAEVHAGEAHAGKAHAGEAHAREAHAGEARGGTARAWLARAFAAPGVGGLPMMPLVAATLAAALLASGTFGPRLHAPDVLAMVAILVAAVIAGVAGFAFSVVCGAVLFHLTRDPIHAVQIMMLCGIANQAAMMWPPRRDLDWPGLSVLLGGGSLGLPFGVWLLVHADRTLYMALLGTFLLGYGAWMLMRRPLTIRARHPALDGVAGFLGGVMGGAVGAPGVPVAIWCGCGGLDETRRRGLLQPFILVMQVSALAAIGVAHPAAGRGVGLEFGALLCVPASLLGTALGMALFRRMSGRRFTRAVNVLLIVSGITYLV